ncbi:MAG: aldo/keto reductase [Erysipelotrichaceae bacterium]|nr:aldo/keto reductase [Erysipelotrichaceae bacterium]
MKYTKLGRTGLTVSRICLGCMSFGDSTKGVTTGKGWALDEEKSREIIRRALDLGINFFDTADTYSGGTSEEFTGRALRDFTKRDEIVLATKVYFPVEKQGPNLQGLSRKHIMSAIDASLTRLGTDYVDLYQIHRWDKETPIEETMEALNDIVRSGKARYIGASSMYAWQFAKAQQIAKEHGWAQFVTMQDLYNLIYREEEREMIPLCADQGVSQIPWSPQAKGRLARKPGTVTQRYENEAVGKRFFPEDESNLEIIHRVEKVSEDKGIPMGQVALAWLLSKPTVAAPIAGATKINHLEEACGAVDVTLAAEEITYLEEAYVPHQITGHS